MHEPRHPPAGKQKVFPMGWIRAPQGNPDRSLALSHQTTATDLQPVDSGSAHRIAMLDGWRASSILLVLAAHLLPMGPKALLLNEAVAAMGMALFFTLSGFLITRFLAAEQASVRVFVIRRFFRIVPLSWLASLIVLTFAAAPAETWFAHLLFFANLPPFWLLPATSHLWSLCVEVQFYSGIALVVAVCGRRGLYVIPVACVGVTFLRVLTGTHISIVTWLRLDEILAGGTLALGYLGWFGPLPMHVVGRINVYAVIPLLFLSSHSAGSGLEYARPYLASTVIGASLVSAPALLTRLFRHRAMIWIANISYALYIIHGVLMHTWLGTGDRLKKYGKRPILIGLTFILAHVSTYKFEQPLVRFAKRMSASR